MSWINEIDVDEAKGELADVYDSIAKSRGKVSNVVSAQSLNPRALKAHMDLYYSTVYGKMALRRVDRELIAVVVSAVNKCPYCIQHHAEALNAYWKNPQRVAQAQEDFHDANLSDAQVVMCQFAENLTRSASSASEEEIQLLREAGFDDTDILNITLIIGYFNFVNRITLALGVEYTEAELQGYSF